MSNDSCRTIPSEVPPMPITALRSARSFISRQRRQVIRRASSPSALPWNSELSIAAASRLLAAVTACRSPVKCRLMSSPGNTCELPPPVPPPLMPKTGPIDGSRSGHRRVCARLTQRLGQADRGRGLTLTRRRWGHPGDQDQVALRPFVQPRHRLGGELGLVASVQVQIVRRQAQLRCHVYYRPHQSPLGWLSSARARCAG